MVRYDWFNLKNKFIMGSWVSVTALFKDQGIKNNSRNRTNARGWVKERSHYIEKINLQAQQRFVENEAAIRVRHQKAALELQLKGLKELQKQPIRNIDDARKLLVDGMREEREALGLNSKTPLSPNLTQVNVNLPKTKFDEILEGKSFEELLELIVAIRKEKARRRLLKIT